MKSKAIRLLLVVAFLCSFVAARPVSAATLSFQQGVAGYSGNWNTFLDYARPLQVFGTPTAAINVRVGQQNGLMRFSLASLPANAYVTSAKLRLYVASRTNPSNTTFQVYKVLRPWIPSAANWHQATATTEWRSVGASDLFVDRSNVAASSVMVTAVNAYYELDLTALVREWAHYPQTNNGFMVYSQSAANVSYAIAADAYPAVEKRPRLTVDYNVSAASDFPPSLSLGAPVHEGFAADNILLAPTIGDDRGISKVEYYLDGVRIATVTASPFTYALDTTRYAAGRHTLKIKAYDTANQTTETRLVQNFYKAPSGIYTIGFITDTHIGTPADYEPVDKSKYTQEFTTVLQHFNDVIKPAVIIHTGDVFTVADEKSTRLYSSIVQTSTIPIRLIPGNHDLCCEESFLYLVGPFKTTFDIGPYRFIGFTSGKLNGPWVRSLLSSTDKKGILFSHYLVRLPAGSTDDGNMYVLNTTEQTKVRSILKTYGVLAYLSGHLHQYFWLEDSGSIEFGGSALSKKDTYQLMTLDNGIVSGNMLYLNEWPAIVITSPQRYIADGGTRTISGDSSIRVVVYDANAVSSVQYKIDNGPYISMTSLGAPVWQAAWASSTVPAGVHSITVRATDTKGLSKATSIQVKLVNPPAAGALETEP